MSTEQFSPLMIQAIDTLSYAHQHIDPLPIGYEQVLYNTLRHGRFEADMTDLIAQFETSLCYRDYHFYDKPFRIVDIKKGQLLHDALGKPVVADNACIWYTNACVSPEELERIIHHPQIGYEYLFHEGERIASDLHPVTYDIVRWHHEKRNGSGPAGKVADELPHAVQFCVVIDQIISRCQPKAYRLNGNHSLSYVLDKVYEGYTSEFNPEIVDTVAAILKRNEHMNIPSLKWIGAWH